MMIAELYDGPRDGEVREVDFGPSEPGGRPGPPIRLSLGHDGKVVPAGHPAAVMVDTAVYLRSAGGASYPDWRVNSRGYVVYRYVYPDQRSGL